MRYLVISDIHANLVAFEAVLADAKGDYDDKIWCLGDVVGYGPHPNECVELLQEYDHLCIAGNHDWAMVDKLNFEEFSPNARFAVLWSQDQMKPENYDYLYNLPLYLYEEEVFTLVHGSLRHPIWEYITSVKVAQLNFGHLETPYCLFGHTHSPVIFAETPAPQTICDQIIPRPDHYTYKLDSQRLIINPGSVGQPRDGDARAAYGILDCEKKEFHIKRVAYDVEKVQKLMQQHDFPAKLWKRLAFGY
jgi:predicted phosphodiesterase